MRLRWVSTRRAGRARSMPGRRRTSLLGVLVVGWWGGGRDAHRPNCVKPVKDVPRTASHASFPPSGGGPRESVRVRGSASALMSVGVSRSAVGVARPLSPPPVSRKPSLSPCVPFSAMDMVSTTPTSVPRRQRCQCITADADARAERLAKEAALCRIVRGGLPGAAAIVRVNRPN